MKQVYIVLTHTGTILSKIVRAYTKHTYTHISIALDKDLVQLYSFGRINPYNAFVGGFVKEGIHQGTFQRFRNTITEVYSLDIEDKQYYKVEKIIKKMENHRNMYSFNILGLILLMFNKRVKRKNKFYCAEFVKYILERASDKVKDLPAIIRPEDFKRLKEINCIYKGYLREYRLRLATV